MYNNTKHEEKKHFCMNCLQCFSSEELLTNYEKVCLKIKDKESVNVPKKGNNLQFDNYHKQWKVSFVIYADFGSNLREVQKPNRDNDDASYTNKYQKHIAYSYGCKVVCRW